MICIFLGMCQGEIQNYEDNIQEPNERFEICLNRYVESVNENNDPNDGIQNDVQLISRIIDKLKRIELNRDANKLERYLPMS